MPVGIVKGECVSCGESLRYTWGKQRVLCTPCAKEAGAWTRVHLTPPQLTAGSEPTRLHRCLTSEDVDANRRVWCKRYGNCLEYAWCSEWISWSCASCPVKDEYTDDEKRALVAAESSRPGSAALMQILRMGVPRGY